MAPQVSPPTTYLEEITLMRRIGKAFSLLRSHCPACWAVGDAAWQAHTLANCPSLPERSYFEHWRYTCLPAFGASSDGLCQQCLLPRFHHIWHDDHRCPNAYILQASLYALALIPQRDTIAITIFGPAAKDEDFLEFWGWACRVEYGQTHNFHAAFDLLICTRGLVETPP
ncbi:hypothetical protein B0H12DRAFT_1080850 [Mycena haematopus]|nr:hypothetical protein B0H12DRAFT_1080850 [Mycena haematopus]